MCATLKLRRCLNCAVNMSTKPRTPRQPKTAIIDIDFANVEPGDNFINWIDLTKQKLKERERKLLTIRISEIESIVNEQVYYKISAEFIESVLNVNFFPIIDEWKGINIWRIKKPLKEFKDYFAKGRNWWDINKQNITGSAFWIPVFEDIRKVHTYYIHTQ